MSEHLRTYVRFAVPPLATALLFALVLFVIVLPSTERGIMRERQAQCQQQVHTVVSLLGYYHGLVVAGALTDSTARVQAMETVRDLRYGSEMKDYFWLQDLRPVMLMHPYRPDLENTNVWNFADAGGNMLFQDFVRVASDSGSGFVSYMWQRHGDSTVIGNKVSFVHLFEPWQMIVGTGVYVDDVRAATNELQHSVLAVSLLILLLVMGLEACLVTSSVRAERLRQQAESRFRELAELLPELVFEIDHTGRLHLINRNAYRVTGYNAEDLSRGMTGTMLVIESDRERFVRNIERVKSGESTLLGQYMLRRSDGGSLPATIHGTPVVKNGQPVGIRGIAVDITYRKEAEDALMREREFSYRLVQASPAYFVAINSAGNVLMMNSEFLRVLGYRENEVYGVEYVETFVPESDRALVADAFTQTKAAGTPINMESRIITRSGELRMVEWRGRQVTDKNGRLDFFF
ncbi:MAG: cache domain-containing protein, partial [candidate division Zixibacteria bacterium]|nr:cache domain-containing protein [candidate division Zixibacteria bacterium]